MSVVLHGEYEIAQTSPYGIPHGGGLSEIYADVSQDPSANSIVIKEKKKRKNRTHAIAKDIFPTLDKFPLKYYSSLATFKI